mmetsp:Transcript_37374/g.101197  ORF Transcript_37374/g.101197 Transcript_37374/m.101197 type:complete len:190 (-) Transcript_37374:665-1234(-)
MYDDVSPNATFDCSLIHDTYSREYCEIDRYEACAVESNCPIEDGECSADAQLQLISFAKCLEWDDGCDDPASAPPCLDEAGMDTAAVTDCATGPDNGAAAIMNSIYAVANASTPVVTGFPDIRINGETTASSFPSSTKELEQAICGAHMYLLNGALTKDLVVRGTPTPFSSLAREQGCVQGGMLRWVLQ